MEYRQRPFNRSFILLAIIAILLILNFSNIRSFFFPLRKRPIPADLEFTSTPAGDSPSTYLPEEGRIIRIVEEVSPAVVNIIARIRPINFWMLLYPQAGQGTGFLIDSKGYVVTNNHVIEESEELIVVLGDGRRLEAQLVGRDPSTDIAVLKIPERFVERTVKLGNSDALKIGQKAIAIGNPFGFSHTVTTGIISATNRGLKTEEGRILENLIQTDCPINPGNSGGPLLDSKGEVIGVNTAILSPMGGAQGIGFAVPINTVREVTSELITRGAILKPWLGVTLYNFDLDPELARRLGLAAAKGAIVLQVVPGGPSYKAGLKGSDGVFRFQGQEFPLGGDIIVGIDGKSILVKEALIREIQARKVGDEVTLEIVRGNERFSKKIVLENWPENLR